MFAMTDLNFSTQATLLAAKTHIGSPPHTGPLDQGSLGRLVGKVMDAEPGERGRYVIANGGAYLQPHEIEALAQTRRYTDWHAGQV
jgi:hypothetical protein